jgi:ribonucleoside-diphosphate reductase alpha chain
LEKITQSVSKVCSGLQGADFMKIATRTVGGLYDGVSSRELDDLSIQTAVGFISEDPIYSKVASRLLDNAVVKEVVNQEIHSFSQSIQTGYDNGLIGDETYEFVMENRRKLNAAIKPQNSNLFDYYGLKVVYDRYLLRHPTVRSVIETPQYFMLRVACGLSSDVREAIEFYNLISSLEYMSSTPTLFNSGTRHPQMSSCYLLDSPMDNLVDIEKRRADIAKLSKWAGGIGLSYSRVRGNGSLIKGTNGKSNGVVPFLHSLSANVAAVNQGGKRKGAAAVYLDTHHPDIMEFLELRDQTGEKEKRAYNLNLANWIPDLFMQRVKDDAMWSLIDSSVAPDLMDLFGPEFEARYLELEAAGKFHKQVRAQSIWSRMMKSLAETGNGWMCWKDTCNLRGNTAVNGSVIHSSNLCTEILEPTHSGKAISVDPTEFKTPQAFKDHIANNNINVIGYNRDTGAFDAISGGETAVCNLGSIMAGRYVKDGKLDKAKLRKNVAIAMKYLDKVIDRNFYPTHEAYASNMRWRPVGLGVMGLQDLLFQLRVPFDSEEAVRVSAELQEEIYYTALKTSMELAKTHGPHQDFEHTHAAAGILQFDLAGQPDAVSDPARWAALKEDITKHGLRNSLTIAIAPTVTIAAITGSYECIEPQVSNLFKTETLSGEFIRINRYLVEDLKKLDLWGPDIINQIKIGEGSIQHVQYIPEEIRALYKTVWEIKQKWLIDHAAARGLFIDQSQSLNLFMETPTVEKLSSMYMYAWKKGIKTTYYLRSRGATKIAKSTVSIDTVAARAPAQSQAPENPDVCESCT